MRCQPVLELLQPNGDIPFKKEVTKIGKRISDLCKELSAYNDEKST
jgi:hypothetical protein